MANKKIKKEKNNFQELHSTKQAKENIKLFEEYAKDKGNLELRNELALLNRPLIGYTLKKYYLMDTPYETKKELEQEGNIGLLAAINGFDYTRGFKFSTYACVPTSTQILTKNGWKYHYELVDGDETLGYNNGQTEWTKIQGVSTYDDAPLVRFGDSLWNTLCTSQHKWLITKNGETKLRPLTEWPSPKNFEWPPYIQGSKEETGKRLYGRPDTCLVTSAPYVGGNSPLTPNEASILGWVLSDGSLLGDWKTGNPSGAVIIQSEKKFANDIRELLKESNAYCSDSRRKDSGCFAFSVKAKIFRKIWEKSGLKNRSIVDLVLDLSPEARKAWFKAWYQAEGTLGTRNITQNNGDKLDALELCAFLEGHQGVHVSPKSDKCSIIGWHSKKRTPRRAVVTPAGTGQVWCPKTDLGSWTARSKEGFTFLTGNTWWIRQAINNYLLNVNPIIRVPSHIRAAQSKLQKKLKLTNNPNNQGLLDTIGTLEPKDYNMSSKAFKSIKSAIKSRQVISLNRPSKPLGKFYPGNENATLESTLESNIPSYEFHPDKSVLLSAVRTALDVMPIKRKLILLLRYDIIKEKEIKKLIRSANKKRKLKK